MKTKLLFFPVLSVLYGCEAVPNSPLYFGQATTLGISIDPVPSGQSAGLVLGFKDANFAVVPTVYKSEEGKNDQLTGKTDGTNPDEDAFSTLGQFEASTQETTVALGKFFATGIAARRLADGFACEVSNGTEAGCTGPGPATGGN